MILTAEAQTQLPNNDFETWEDNYNAAPWRSVGITAGSYSIYSAEKTNDAYQGSAAAKLKTQSFYGQIIPGYFSLGNFDFETLTPSGGIAFADRPTGISLYYKYLPQQTDTMVIYGILTKWDAENAKTDTVGLTGFISEKTINAYTKLQLPFIYFSELTPDTLNIGMLSSALTPQEGSELYADSLTMLYGEVHSSTICLPASNYTDTSFTATWVPVPDADSYQLEVARDINFTDYVSGFNPYIADLSASYIVNVPSGLYFYRVNPQYETETGGWSNTISVPMPTSIYPESNIKSDSFTANWKACEQATTYYLDLSESASFDNFVSGCENINAGNTLNYNFTNLAPNTTYYYRIRTEYSDYLSQNSETKQVATNSSAVDLIHNDIKITTNNKTIYIDTKRHIRRVKIYNIQGQSVKEGVQTKYTITKAGLYFIKIDFENDACLTNKIIVR